MTIQNRANEILDQMTAFSKESYTKEEYLPELLKLQSEIVRLTFNDEHAEEAKLRLWDVSDHLKMMNTECGGVADHELHKFLNSSKKISSEIKAEISGFKGEQIVFNALESLSCYNAILRNVELEYDGKRTEIDAIVFTHRAVFIIEIKNSKKNIFIDEEGGFYRTGQSMHYDCNIADKMYDRYTMLKKALDTAGLGYVKIFNIVTFTNPRIDVENKYYRLKVCGSNYLPTYIDKFQSDNWYSDENIGTMVTAVEDAKCKEPFQMPVNMDDFKLNFATLMATLECAKEEKTADAEIDEVPAKGVPQAKNDENETVHIFRPSIFRRGVVAASVGIAVLNIAAFGINALLKSTR